MAPAADEPGQTDLHLLADWHGELLRRIAQRDREAYEVLYRRYARPVYGLALRRLRDHERAEDATRQAFAAVWRSASAYVPERGDGVRWLFTVARDVIAGHARRASAESPAEDGWPDFRVHAAVAELPERERVPLELAYWGGRSRNEIAELLGLPLDTVETRTRSALTRLAVWLEDAGETDA
jgi:RNA polymerase sigma-70 factor, ECF subfamily